MKKKIHSLLIGITDYPSPNELYACTGDVEKIKDYLLKLNEKDFEVVQPTVLLNQEATKEGIVAAISQKLKDIEDQDTFLIYYSGHGGQEKTNGRFIEEHDGLLECIICYYEDSSKDDFLLADKEIRYLFSQVKSNPHLVTVFDCCHSGDMTRNFVPEVEKGKMRKRRIPRSFEARTANRFIFKDEVGDLDQFKTSRLSEEIPNKNHLHLAAALSSESAWEDDEGGVFTRYLLKLLNHRNSAVSYYDIARYAKISLQNMTEVRQTPIVQSIGEGSLSRLSSWLGLKEEIGLPNGMISFNDVDGWKFSQGLLLGVKEGMKVQFEYEGKIAESTITYASLEYSNISDPFEDGIQIDENSSFEATCLTSHSPLVIHVNDLDGDPKTLKEVKELIKQTDRITEGSKNEAKIQYTIFNQCLYLNYAEAPFHPLNEQIDLLDQKIDLDAQISYQLRHVLNWSHFNTLESPNAFAKMPIAIHVDPTGSKNYPDLNLSNNRIELVTDRHRLKNGKWVTRVNVRVTNISSEKLYIACLSLETNLEINAPLGSDVVELLPGQSKEMFEDRENITLTIPIYKEVYNWKEHTVALKFVVSNTSDFSTIYEEATQDGLGEPWTLLDKSKRGRKKSFGDEDDIEEREERWQVFTTYLDLINPTYNQISGHLDEDWEHYIEDERIGPFISKQYFQPVSNGFAVESETFSSAHAPQRSAKGWKKMKVDVANYLDNKRRLRRFKKAKQILPQAPVVLAEGDSWFLYPFLVKDTLDYVMEAFPTRSLAAAGAELLDYKNSGQLVKEVERIQPKYVLISGGGNDVVGPEVEDILVKGGVAPGQAPIDYLLPDVYQKVRQNLVDLYTYFFDFLENADSVRHVFVHGYANVKARHEKAKIIDDGWVNKYMIKYGMNDPDDRQRLIIFLVENFNTDLKKLTDQYGKVTYLDMRPLIKDDEWHDEIHPTDEGFKKVGMEFINAIKKQEAQTA